MNSPTQYTGYKAERLAESFLSQKGYRLLKRQFRTSLGEIDLIMLHQQELVFVEVRFRKRNDYVDPIESVHYYKRKNLIRTALIYMQQQPWTDKLSKRFDIISVTGNQLNPKITWIPNAFGVE